MTIPMPRPFLVRWIGRLPLQLTILGASLALYPGAASLARPLGSQGDHFLYQVEAGDTLEALARRYTLNPLNWRPLQDLNQVADPYQLAIGRVLRIPLAMIPRHAAQAVVTHVSGAVTRSGRPLRAGDTLQTGDALRSGDGSATLTLEDHSTLTVSPGSDLRIRTLQTFQGTGLTDTVLDLPQGDMDSSVAPDKTGVGRFEIRTPATVTGVRGTRLRIHANPSGSRHEVIKGQAAVQAATQAEQQVVRNHGTAYDASGAFLGARELLPAPVLNPLDASASALSWAAVPGATAYRVRLTLDEDGANLQSSQRVAHTRATLPSSGSGPRYVFVRAIDALGIEGSDAMLGFQAIGGLVSSDGRPVLGSDGSPIRLSND